MTEIMPVPRILILLSYQQGAFGLSLFAFCPEWQRHIPDKRHRLTAMAEISQSDCLSFGILPAALSLRLVFNWYPNPYLTVDGMKTDHSGYSIRRRIESAKRQK